MRVLVTGGGGFIGLALVRALIDRGYQVSSLSRNHYSSLEELGVNQFVGDLCEPEKVHEACNNIDAVFHVAAKVGLWGKFSDFYSTNVIGTENVISSCKAQGVKYLIFTSSASVVFDGKDILNGTESLPYPAKPMTNYTNTKGKAEQLILMANSSLLKTISLRPHLVWGPGDNHLVPGIINRAKSGRLTQIGENIHDIDTTYIDNYTHAQLCALDALIEGEDADGKAYFITNGEPQKVWDFINSIIVAHDLPRVTKKINRSTASNIAMLLENFHRLFVPWKEPMLTRFAINELCTSHWFDISKAKDLLLYKPLVSTEEGINKLIADSEGTRL